MMIRRSRVTPKLVSNGCRSRIRISRSSIREINTGCTSDEDVVTGLSMPFEASNVEVVFDVCLKFFANAWSLRPRKRRIGRDGYPALIALDHGARSIQPPLGNQPVTVVVIKGGIEPPDDDTQLFNVEIRVARDQRIESPLNQLNAALEGMSFLSRLQLSPDTRVARSGCNREHMRMPVRLPVSNSRNGAQKSDQLRAVEGAEDQSPDVS